MMTSHRSSFTRLRYRCGRGALPILTLALVLALGGCASNPVTGTPDLVLMTETEEIELGARYHQQVLAQYRVYGDPDLQDYLAGLGSRLSLVSHRPQLGFSFTLLDSPEVNAFAVPGGHVYVTRGILAYLQSEAELAAVVGHEIGHVAARHAVRLHAGERIKGVFDTLLFDHLGLGIGDSLDQLGTALMRGYERRHELEADRLAVEYLDRAGYPPAAMSRVVEVLSSLEQAEQRRADLDGGSVSGYHGLFATHPDNDQRRTAVTEALALRPPRAGDDRPDSYLARIDGLVFGPSSEQGLVDGRRYLHGPSASGLVAPAHWSLDSDGQILTLAPPARDAVIQVVHERRGAGTTPRSLLRELLQSDSLREETDLSGDGPSGARLRGWMATGDGQTPFGHGEVRFAAWLNGDHAWIFLGTSRRPGAYRSEIDACMRSFFHLDESDLALTRPLRLTLHRAGPGDSFAALAAAGPPGADTENRLRLLNGRTDPADQPRPGELIKVLRR